MPVELPSPGLRGRRFAHDGDPVTSFSIADKVVIVELAQRMIQLHDVARELQPFGAQRRAHQLEGRLSLAVVHAEKAGALAHIVILIHPLPPFDVVCRKKSFGPQRGIERRKKGAGGVANRFRRDARRPDREEVRLNCAVRGDPFEGLSQSACLRLDRHLAEAIGLRHRTLLGARVSERQ